MELPGDCASVRAACLSGSQEGVIRGLAEWISGWRVWTGVLMSLEGSEVTQWSILGLTGHPDCGMTQEVHFALCGRHPEMVARVCESCEHGGWTPTCRLRAQGTVGWHGLLG